MWDAIKQSFASLWRAIKLVPAFLRSVIGSRMGMAVSAAFLVAFGVQSLNRPEELPRLGGVPLWQLGIGPAPAVTLPPVQLPEFIPADIQADAITAARAKALATRDTLTSRTAQRIQANAQLTRAFNYGGTVLALLGLIVATLLRADYLRRTQYAQG
jgi:hypothetical protein